MIPTIDSITSACGIIINPRSAEGFRHLATAWQLASGEWLCAWQEDEQDPTDLQLIHAHSGKVCAISHWEQDSGLAGFRSDAVEQSLSISDENTTLSKREPLLAVGYPSVISHPAFSIHRGSLSGELYHPYLCPWIIEGHLCTLYQGPRLDCGHRLSWDDWRSGFKCRWKSRGAPQHL